MSVIVVGLEQQQTPLDLLERVTIPEEAIGKALANLRDRSNLAEVVVLSTCLRTELYAVVERFHEGVADLQDYLAALAGRPAVALEDNWTVLFDDGVTSHLFEVAAGLRSSVPGETEVLGQVRRALDRAEAERAAGPVLSGLFRQAVQVGRRVRSSTAIARGSTSLSHVAVEVAAAHAGGSLANRKVVVVGAGDMGAGVVEALARRGWPARLVVANRTTRRAAALAARLDGEGMGLEELRDVVAASDVVFASTAAALPVLDEAVLGHAAAQRAREHGAPLVVVDLGVPRNVDPGVGDVAGIELLDMDDLTRHAEASIAGRKAELVAAHDIVRTEVDRFLADERARGAAPVVSALRGRVEEVRQAELERHRARLAGLSDEQIRAVDAVVRDVLAKVLHQPSVALKEAAGTPRGERLVEALRTLFDL